MLFFYFSVGVGAFVIGLSQISSFFFYLLQYVLTLRTLLSPDSICPFLQVVKMLFAIVMLFILCWGPIMTNNLLVAFNVLDYLHMGSLKHIRQALLVLSYFNSCVNPIVYGFMSKNFRQAFLSTLSAICHVQDSDTQGNGSVLRISFQTRSTSFPCRPRSSKRDSNDRPKSMTDMELHACQSNCK